MLASILPRLCIWRVFEECAAAIQDITEPIQLVSPSPRLGIGGLGAYRVPPVEAEGRLMGSRTLALIVGHLHARTPCQAPCLDWGTWVRLHRHVNAHWH